MTMAAYSGYESDFGLGPVAQPIAYEHVLPLTDEIRTSQN